MERLLKVTPDGESYGTGLYVFGKNNGVVAVTHQGARGTGRPGSTVVPGSYQKSRISLNKNPDITWKDTKKSIRK